VKVAAAVDRAGGTLGLIALIAVLTGCGDQTADSPAQGTSSAAARAAPSGHLVTTIVAERAPVAMRYERPGSLALRRVVRIYSQEEGRIIALDGFEGDKVRAGQTLVQLEDALLRAELDAARATRAQERLDLRRLEGLSKRGGASEDEIAQARTAVAVAEAQVQILETRLDYTRIAAPFDGVITQRLVEPGDFVAKNTQLLTVADPASLIAEVPVSELVLPQLAVDDTVQIKIDALGGLGVTGTILRIHPTLTETGRQATVEVAPDSIPEGARAGQFVRVAFSSARVPRLLIPFRALRQDRDGAFVWIVGTQDKAARRQVRTGVRVGDQVEVVQGLEPGDQIITRGFLGLAVGDEVHVVEAPQL
jgi:RND family efflux transporter MFP subunit